MLPFDLIFSSTKPSTSYKCGKKHCRDGKKIRKTLCPEMPALCTHGWCEVSTPPAQQLARGGAPGQIGALSTIPTAPVTTPAHSNCWNWSKASSTPLFGFEGHHWPSNKPKYNPKIVTFLLQPADLHSVGDKEWEMLEGVAPETRAEGFQSSSNCSYKRTSRTILSKFHQVSNTFQTTFNFSLMKQAIKLQGPH